MKKNQSFKVSPSTAVENIEIISDFKTAATMQNPPQPPKVNLRYGELELNKNIKNVLKLGENVQENLRVFFWAILLAFLFVESKS